jgi:uncharacterized membrane protein YidH (DUF202 family)
MNKAAKAYLCLIAIFGLASLVLGIVYYQKNDAPSNFKDTQGTIVSMYAHRKKQCATTTDSLYTGPICKKQTDNIFYANVEFSAEPRHFNFTEKIGGASINNYQRGTKVRIAYNPNNPGVGAIDLSNNLDKLTARVFIAVGLVLFLPAVVTLLVKRGKPAPVKKKLK